MATDDVQIIAVGTAAAPFDYTVPHGQEIMPLAVEATFDGSGAATPFLPCLTIIGPGGIELATLPADASITAGATGQATWAPFLRGAQAAASGLPVARWTAPTITCVPGVDTYPTFTIQGGSNTTYYGTQAGAGPAIGTTVALIKLPGLYLVWAAGGWGGTTYGRRCVLLNQAGPAGATYLPLSPIRTGFPMQVLGLLSSGPGSANALVSNQTHDLAVYSIPTNQAFTVFFTQNAGVNHNVGLEGGVQYGPPEMLAVRLGGI